MKIVIYHLGEEEEDNTSLGIARLAQEHEVKAIETII